MQRHHTDLENLQMNHDSDRIRAALGLLIGRTIEHTNECPDCDASVTVVEHAPGLFVMTVLHDDTCPRLARMEGRP